MCCSELGRLSVAKMGSDTRLTPHRQSLLMSRADYRAARLAAGNKVLTGPRDSDDCRVSALWCVTIRSSTRQTS